MKAYWPEAKMIGRHEDVMMYDSKGIKHLVEVERKGHTPRAAVHYDASLYLGKSVACGFVATRSITTSELPDAVTCRACVSLVRILFGG